TSSIFLNYVQVANGTLYWVESRPADGGRNVLVTNASVGDGAVRDLTPAGFSARTRVHEYGGKPFAIGRGVIFFSNFADQRVYAHRAGQAPVALTPEGYRYADYELSKGGDRLLCVREDHTGSGEPRNAIVALDTHTGGPGTVLFDKSDFVAYPRLSPDGRRIAWIAWNHPDLPWDATTLYVADFDGTRLSGVTALTSGVCESVLEPCWDTDGSLYFLSDRSNWWNLYRFKDGHVSTAFAIEAEIGSPLWTLGQSSYALTGDGRAIVRYTVSARDKLGMVDLNGSGKLTPFDLPFVGLSNIQVISADKAAAVAAAPTTEAALVSIDLGSGSYRILRAPGSVKLSPDSISVAEPIEFPTAGGLTAHAFFYPPTNPQASAPPGEKPPLVVKVHGGPTSHSKAELALTTQYWTSRGFALLDVNHGGSSGFGRAYRERLNGKWGVVDVGDVVAAVKYLIASGRVDGNRAAIRGGSAGGFTVLATLAFHDVFRAGANYYGVSDLEALARDSHKFEARYLDRLVAPLPEGREIYQARAPIRHLESFKAALITFQGADDKVVPPDQSRAIVAALKAKGVPVAYIEFEGEQHGFRRAENIVRSLESELAFYGRVFGFKPDGVLPEVALLE
ncbi:MAG TPA: prolyl oligopeptidase family serine peptidase, partial [Steroidobacteraceae bacterium]